MADNAESFAAMVAAVSDIVWGPWMLGLIGATGIILTLMLGFLPLRKLGFGFRQLLHRKQGEGTIAGYAALATSLAATIGTGNIAGVATAIHLGGPGALVWMWLIALVGMATKLVRRCSPSTIARRTTAGSMLAARCTTFAMASARVSPGWRACSPCLACLQALASATWCRHTRWQTACMICSMCPKLLPV